MIARAGVGGLARRRAPRHMPPMIDLSCSGMKEDNDDDKIIEVRAHSIAGHSCGRSSPVALALEPVVEINPLGRDTGLL